MLCWGNRQKRAPKIGASCWMHCPEWGSSPGSICPALTTCRVMEVQGRTRGSPALRGLRTWPLSTRLGFPSDPGAERILLLRQWGCSPGFTSDVPACGPGSSCEAEGYRGWWWGTPVTCLHRWPLSHSVLAALLLTMGWAQLQKGRPALGVACAGGARVHGHIDSEQPPEHRGH